MGRIIPGLYEILYCETFLRKSIFYRYKFCRTLIPFMMCLNRMFDISCFVQECMLYRDDDDDDDKYIHSTLICADYLQSSLHLPIYVLSLANIHIFPSADLHIYISIIVLIYKFCSNTVISSTVSTLL